MEIHYYIPPPLAQITFDSKLKNGSEHTGREGEHCATEKTLPHVQTVNTCNIWQPVITLQQQHCQNYREHLYSSENQCK